MAVVISLSRGTIGFIQLMAFLWQKTVNSQSASIFSIIITRSLLISILNFKTCDFYRLMRMHSGGLLDKYSIDINKFVERGKICANKYRPTDPPIVSLILENIAAAIFILLSGWVISVCFFFCEMMSVFCCRNHEDALKLNVIFFLKITFLNNS